MIYNYFIKDYNDIWDNITQNLKTKRINIINILKYKIDSTQMTVSNLRNSYINKDLREISHKLFLNLKECQNREIRLLESVKIEKLDGGASVPGMREEIIRSR